jgi:hypothetical protein
VKSNFVVHTSHHPYLAHRLARQKMDNCIALYYMCDERLPWQMRTLQCVVIFHLCRAAHGHTTPGGLEPAIPGSVGRCLIRRVTGPMDVETYNFESGRSDASITKFPEGQPTQWCMKLVRARTRYQCVARNVEVDACIFFFRERGLNPSRAELNGFRVHLLAARTQCRAMKERGCATKLFHVH